MQGFAWFDKSEAFYLVLRQYIAYVWLKIPSMGQSRFEQAG
jgi:hypothetical protein